MERGENNSTNIITITKDEESKKIEVNVSGLWNGKDRHRISRMLLREMRSATHKEIQVRKQADLTTELEKKRLAGLVKARAAKKEKKLEEEKKNVRGQRKPKSK